MATGRFHKLILGTNLTGTDNADDSITIDAAGGGHTIEDEGTPLTDRSKLNFVGAGVTVTDDSGDDASVVTIPGGGGSGSLILIGDSTLGSDAANFDFTSIAATWAHLFLVMYLRSDRAAPGDTIAIRFNNDSGANYYSQEILVTNTTVSGSQDIGATRGVLGFCPSNTATANFFGAAEALIPHYKGSTNKKTVASKSYAPKAASSGNLTMDNAGTFWNNTAAITRVTVLPYAGTNWKAGSRVSLYGILV